MSKKAKEAPNEVFLMTFIGEYVQAISSLVLNTSTNEGVEQAPLILEGYLLDMDNDYIYMGDNAQNISRALKKDSVVFIQVLNNQEDLLNLLDKSNKSKRDLN